jgi:hypothetical protein
MLERQQSMDAFDYVEEQKAKPSRNVSALIFNLLTVLVLIGVILVGVIAAIIFLSPQSGINPFPPPTLPALASFPTRTPTASAYLPPTWTPMATLKATATQTPAPTSTSLATETTVVLPEATITPLEISFEVQEGNPVAISSTTFRPDQGCNWMGVGGQALDLSGAPVQWLIVQLGGVLDGKVMEQLTMTGTATQYDQGGYEFTLDNEPVASKDTMWIQLLDQVGLPLSEKIYFETFDDCEKNLIVINFKQVR